LFTVTTGTFRNLSMDRDRMRLNRSGWTPGGKRQMLLIVPVGYFSPAAQEALDKPIVRMTRTPRKERIPTVFLPISLSPFRKRMSVSVCDEVSSPHPFDLTLYDDVMDLLK
jgi:hypothetical protein